MQSPGASKRPPRRGSIEALAAALKLAPAQQQGSLSTKTKTALAPGADPHGAAVEAEVLARNIVVLEGLCAHPAVALDARPFAPATLLRERGHEVVPIIRQIPCTAGWRLPPQRATR